MVGYHEGEPGAQLARVPAPQEIQQAVVVAGDHYRHPLGLVGVGHAPVHRVLASERGEGGLELLPAEAEALALDLHPQKEAAPRGGEVLVYAQHVAVVLLDEGRDRGDQTLPVGAPHQQVDVVAHDESDLGAR